MKFELIEGLTSITLDLTVTLAFAAVLLLLGYFVKNKVSYWINIVSLHLL